MNIQMKSKDISILRDKLLQEQNNKCKITGKEIDRPVLDHEHDKGLNGSGNIRGVISSNINVFLAKSENNCKRYGISLEELPTVLRQIADYIEAGDYVDEEGNTYRHPSEKPKDLILQKSSYNKLKKVYNGKAKFPEYKNKQKLTKQLEKLFNKYQIKPKFY